MTHDPMLDGIRRWVYSQTTGAVFTGEGGEFVLFSDLPALIAAVRQDEANRKPEPPHDQHWYADNLCSYCIGYAAALRDAKAAVMAVSGGVRGLKVHEHYRNCIAAIEVLGGAR